MKKVLVFGMSDNPGGVESVIMNYFLNVDKTKIQFDFICNSKKIVFEDEICKNGGNIFHIKPRSKNPILFYKQTKKIFSQNTYDAIWVNLCSLANISYLKFAKKFNIPVRIVHAHNSQHMDSKLRAILHTINKSKIQKYATDFWSCDISASKFFYPKSIISSDKHKIINNAIDVDKFQYDKKIREKYRKLLNIEDNLVVGHIGRLHFQKNQEFLMKVFRELKRNVASAKLLLVGKGEDEEKLRALAKKLEIENDVIFLGQRNDIEKILQAIDIFVFPSVFEGLPVILFEAQAAGLPILASDSISKQSKVTDNFHWLSLNDPPTVWSEKIQAVLKFPSNRETWAKDVKDAGFDIKKQAKTFSKLILGEDK